LPVVVDPPAIDRASANRNQRLSVPAHVGALSGFGFVLIYKVACRNRRKIADSRPEVSVGAISTEVAERWAGGGSAVAAGFEND